MLYGTACQSRTLTGSACLGSLGNPGGLGEAGYVDGLSMLSQSSFSELLFVSHCEVVQAQQSVRIKQVRISVRAVIVESNQV